MTDQKPTIFIIDDDPSALKGLSRLVSAAGFQVEVYDSARAFLDRNHTNKHGCIVLDMKMPKMNGLELQEALIEIDSSLPIIFLSGHADVPTAALGMKKGAVDFCANRLIGYTCFGRFENL